MKGIGLKIALFFAACCFTFVLLAQKTTVILPEKSPAAVLMARTQAGKVQLRWLPLEAALWRTANRNGWVVERMELSENGVTAGFRPLSKTPFKPLSEGEWLRQTDTTNKYVQIARRAVSETAHFPSAGAKFDAIQAYQNEENALFSYFLLSVSLSEQAAKGAALGFDDLTAEKGKAYMYRAYVPNAQKGQSSDTAFAVVRDWTTPSVSAAVDAVRVEEGEGNVTVFWQRALNEQKFIAYDVERSADGGKSFKAINRLPFYLSSESAPELRYVDSVKNYTPYIYRVVGYTYFGDKGTPSKPINAIGRDRSPALGAVNTRAEGNTQQITITWELPAISKDFAGFYVGRSNDAEGQFNYLNTKLLPPSARSFTDAKPYVFEPFYVVHAVDTAGNISMAYPAMASVLDTIPPAQPKLLRGVCDSNGVVTLTWEAVKDLDVQGYYVYRANERNAIYYPLSKAPFSEPFFTDTVSIKALNREIFYKITAVDQRYNPSPYSEIAVVQRPDIIPPAPPVFSAYDIIGDSVTLNWQNSPSRDVAVYTLKRRIFGQNTEGSSFEKIASFDKSKAVRQFTDVKMRGGQTYEYILEAKDEAGNIAASRPIRLQIQAFLAEKDVKNLQIEVDKETGATKLSWQYLAAAADPRCRYVIYRSRVGEELSTYESVTGRTPQYADTLPQKGAWQYAVKAIHADGSESNLSAVVVVKM
jgi:uncharacterized protein